MKIGIIVIMVFSMILVRSASASIVKIEYHGTVTDARLEEGFSFDGSVGLLSEMHGYCLYDTSSADRNPDSSVGNYDLIYMEIDVGNYRFKPATDDAARYDVILPTVYTPEVRYRATSGDSYFEGIIYDAEGQPKRYDDYEWPYGFGMGMTLLWEDEGQTDAFPTADTFEPFNPHDGWMGAGNDNGEVSFIIYGRIDSVHYIPEPGSILLLGLGGLVLVRRRRVGR